MSLDEHIQEIVDGAMAPWVDKVREAAVGDCALTRAEVRKKLGKMGEHRFKRLLDEGLVPPPHPFLGNLWSSRQIDAYLAGDWRPTAPR